MSLDCRVFAQRIERRKALGECHLVVQPVQPFVAQSAQRNALLQGRAVVALAEVVAAVHLARNQVVKGQCGMATAQRALTGFRGTGHDRSL